MEFLHFLAQHRSPGGEIFFQGVTYLAQEVIVVAIICWLFWCSNKRLAYTLGFAYFTSGLMVQGLKITFRVDRPWILDPSFSPVASAVPGATGYSFPSGHTQSITALFGTLFLVSKKAVSRLLCTLIILLVAFSRMYLGCHTPADVGTSLVLTMLFVLITWALFYRRDWISRREGMLSVLMALASVGLCIYTASLYGAQVIDLSYAQDCFKASGAGAAFALGFYVERRFIRFQVPTERKQKLARLLFGLLVALLIQEGLKPLIGTSLPASFFRYFLVVIWVLILYPLLFTYISRKKRTK